MCDLKERRRPDDTNDTYFMRTSITGYEPVSDEAWRYVMASDNNNARLSNIIYETLMYTIYAYDTTSEEGNSMLRIIYAYTGWLYGFRFAPSRKEISRVATHQPDRSLEPVSSEC